MNPQDFYKTYLQYPQISTDSRKVKPGCLYFSLRGENFDGNRFAADALAKGSVFAIVDDESVVNDERYILVPDVLRFLQELAVFHRSNLTIPVIGLTGTNGKTTTKELIGSVLRQKFETVCTSGNLNNHIGVPVTLLSTRPETEILVLEMGANHPGEIDFLCALAQPNIGLITNIGKAHLEGFGSFSGVIQTKNELYNWIKRTRGILFCNADDQLLKDLVGDYPCSTYGTMEGADVYGSGGIREHYLSIRWKAREDADYSYIKSNLTGGYNIYNILAAISIGKFFGLTKDEIAIGISSFVPDNMRSQWTQTSDNVLLLDAYNANPSSMALALSHFASLSLPNTVLILGDMFELGSQAFSEHRGVVQLADQLGFRDVFFVGQNFYRLATESGYLFFEDLSKLQEHLTANPLRGCNILIKGSRGMRLEQLISYL